MLGHIQPFCVNRTRIFPTKGQDISIHVYFDKTGISKKIMMFP